MNLANLTARQYLIARKCSIQGVSIFKQCNRSSVQQADSNLKSDVINLYKNLIYLSRDWHHDLKPQIKNAFIKNKDVTDPDQIRALVDKGEYVCREIIATYRLKKYRAMKRRYYSDGDNKHLEDLFKSYQS